MHRRTKLISLLALVLVTLSVAAISRYAIRWRVQFVTMKLTGRVPYMSWSEVMDVLGSTESRGVTTVERGRQLFQQQCAECHGGDARGGSGPDLTRGAFQYGGSDAELARTITEGVRGTAMQPRTLPSQDVQQLIAFIRAAMASDTSGADSSRLAAPVPFNVTFEDIAAAASDSTSWLTYSGSYDGQRHSRLSQISRANVTRLELKWLFQVPRNRQPLKTTPLVVGDAMFVTLPPNHVWALDARTGREIWSWSGPRPEIVKASDVANRGLAIYGNTLYLGTMDAHLVALNAQTGELLWDVTVAEVGPGYSITSAPLAIRDKVIIGNAGGDFATRGFIDAYSASTGERLWRFYTIPGPGEPGHETWGGGRAWRKGGAAPWLTGSYDPELDLIYWGIGNPAPDFLGEVRPGANLYSCSVVAIEAQTGRLRWHFQFTPHDEHDWDAAQIPVLADASFNGERRKLMYWANRNAFYYILDRETGEYLHATAFAEQTWALGIDSTGVPIERPGTRPTPQGTIVTPASRGATNWWSPTYDPGTGTFYVPVADGAGVFTKGVPSPGPDGLYLGSGAFDNPPRRPSASIRALDASTGDVRWEYRFPPRTSATGRGGLLSTAGGLVFGGDERRFVALDSDDGRELWYFDLGGAILGAPITYFSNGRQHITVAAGMVIATFALD